MDRAGAGAVARAIPPKKHNTEASSVFKLNDYQIQQYNNSVFPIKQIYQGNEKIYQEKAVIG